MSPCGAKCLQQAHPSWKVADIFGYVLKGSKLGASHCTCPTPPLQNINEEEGGADRVWPPRELWSPQLWVSWGLGKGRGLLFTSAGGGGRWCGHQGAGSPQLWVSWGLGQGKGLHIKVLGWGTGCGHQGAGSPQLWVSNNLGNHAGLRIHKCPATL